MSDRIDFSSFRDNAPIITISLSGRDANICVFFSMNCCTKMFEHHEQGDDFRTAFEECTAGGASRTARVSRASICWKALFVGRT